MISIDIKTRPCDICHKGMVGIGMNGEALCYVCAKKKAGIPD